LGSVPASSVLTSSLWIASRPCLGCSAIRPLLSTSARADARGVPPLPPRLLPAAWAVQPPLATGAAAAGLWALLAAPPTGFGNLADELEAHAVALHETADSIVTQLQELPTASA